MKIGAKRMSIRHGHGSRRGCNAQEKAIETSVRQEGKKAAEVERWCGPYYRPTDPDDDNYYLY